MPRRILCALAAALSLAGCLREDELSLDWLSGHERTPPREERSSFAAEALVAHPGARGFTPFTVRTRSGIPIVWMLRRRARVDVDLFAPGPRELLLEGGPLEGSAAFELFLDGEFVERFEWERVESARVPIPAERIGPGVHEVEIRLDPEMEASHSLPGAGGLRAFGFALRTLAIVSPAGNGVRVRGRWLPSVAGGQFRARGRAGAEGTRVWLLREGGGREREVLRTQLLGASEEFEWRLPTGDEPGALQRLTVVEAGDVEWEELGPTLPAVALRSRRNLILITLDTTRRDALGCYRDLDGSALLGEGASPTPRLDALAENSLFCRRAFSPAPVTAPTHASLLLSQPPAAHGLRVNGLPLPASSEQSLVARLQAWGYRTAAFVSLGVLAEDAGFAQDFDLFDDEMRAGWWRDGGELNERLFAWIEEESRWPPGPRFLWLHYSDPHKPYAVREEDGYGLRVSWDDGPESTVSTVGREQRIPLPLAPGEHRLELLATRTAREALESASSLYRIGELKFNYSSVALRAVAGVDEEGLMGERAEYRVTIPEALRGGLQLILEVEDLAPHDEIRRRYLEEISRMDASIGAAVDRLDAAGWLDGATIAVVADHGEDLGLEDGRFGHVEHLGPTLSSVGMFVRDALRPGWVLEEPVSVTDLAPTLLHALGHDAGPESFGRNLFDSGLAPRPLYLETFPPEAARNWRSTVWGRHKLDGVVNSDGSLEGPLRLFDLLDDPRCEVDLLADGDGAGPVGDAEWERLLAAWTNWTGTAGEIPEVDPAMHERLRALGYVD